MAAARFINRNCLFALKELDVKAVLRGGGSDDDLVALIRRSVHDKWEGHDINTSRFVKPALGLTSSPRGVKMSLIAIIAKERRE